MKVTHTPAPWSVKKASPQAGIITAPNRSLSIAEVFGGGETDIANARLISAAPELMDLVLQAHERFTDNDMLPPNHKLSQWLKKAESLFAKVGGY